MKKHLLVLCGLVLAGMADANTGCRYLVISADSFIPLARQLADWKTSKGMQARVVPASQVGTSPAAVQSYIRSAWSSWSPRPEYVLIVGNPTSIPAYQSSYDTYYGDMAGDYVMEIPVGRLPANNMRECSTLVFKILNYERPTDRSDTLWLLRGTTTVAEESPPDQYYQADARMVRAYWQQAGFIKAESLCNLYGHASADVTAAANNGRAFITYRGLASGSWWNPFHQVNPFSWANGRHLPVVVGATCYTVTLSLGESMYGDKFVRAGSTAGLGGAVAYFGTTQGASSVSRFRSAAYRGFFKALYEEGAFRLGDATLRARFRVDSLYRNQTRYMEWNLLGDPELNVWTRAPRHATAAHDTLIPFGPQQFRVLVRQGASAVPGAQVCVSMDSSVYAWGTTDSTGAVYLAIAPTHAGTAKVVVTGRNLWPLQQTCRVSQPVHDVTCSRVLVPAGVVDSSQPVTPACSVYNAGSVPETYSVRMRIGAVYDTCVTVAGHAAGTSVRVTFPNWTPCFRGEAMVSCSTRLAGDARPENDRSSGSTRVRVFDAAAIRVEEPEDTVEAGQAVTPMGRFRNPGSDVARFWAYFTMAPVEGGPAHRESIAFTLAPGAESTCGFTPVIVPAPGEHRLTCFNRLSGDRNRRNDSCRSTIFARSRPHDVGAVRIIAPVGIVELETTFCPRAMVANYGPTAENFAVVFRISAGYADTQQVLLEAGACDTVEFLPWTARPMGTYVAGCSTMLVTDVEPANDAVRDTFEVSERTGVAELRALGGCVSLEPIRPNPCRGTAVIRFAVPSRRRVAIDLIAADGRLLCRVSAAMREPGAYAVACNVRGERGQRLPAGVYYCRLAAGGEVRAERFVLAE